MKTHAGITPSPATRAPASTNEPRTFLEGHDEFALALYRRLAAVPGNLFFSPFSVRAALAMAFLGARGATAEQMRHVLRFPGAGEGVHAELGAISHRIASGSGGGHEVAIANSLWCQEAYPLLPAFLDAVDRHYGGGAHTVDFRAHAETAREEINAWVATRTRDRIAELIPSGVLTTLTRVVLANAVYFKGTWLDRFEESLTREEPFHLDHGRQAVAPLMTRSMEVPYVHGGGYQAIELLYETGALSMLVLLPDGRDGLGDLEAKLSTRMLLDCAAEMAPRMVEIHLPRFRLDTAAMRLGALLGALGMPLAFSESEADFSGVNGVAPPEAEALHISEVVHEAHVEVNEEGTEAVAATAVDLQARSAPLFDRSRPTVFRADHPFVFAIRERRSGAILFLGRVSDPTRSG